MRARYDENGKLIGFHDVVFDELPDDYQIGPFLPKGKAPDLSFLGVMKHLRNERVADEFTNNSYYAKEVLSHLAMDYLCSALFLQNGIWDDRDKDVVSLYLIPCAFLCKHSVELKIKECMLEKRGIIEKNHSVLALWNALDERDITHYDVLTSFIQELETLDKNEMALRYGVSVKLEPLPEEFKFDIDMLLANTKFFFNVVDEYVICKYRYHAKD